MTKVRGIIKSLGPYGQKAGFDVPKALATMEDRMCDYSLEMYRSRLATAGEKYVLHGFRSGTLGFVDPADCTTAVCMPVGTRLRLQAISAQVQQSFSLGATADVTMIRIPNSRSLHRDGVRVADGREILLQRLNPGVSALLLPRDLEAVLGLQECEAPSPSKAESAALPTVARAVERFAQHLFLVRLSLVAWRWVPGLQRRRLSTIDA
jgi:hypothetical protein